LSPRSLDFSVLSVAFVREAGVFQIGKLLTQNSGTLKIFAGIRNGVTSAQGLMSLLKCGIKLYAVDTGSSTPIFHPKFYLASKDKKGFLVIGSANLTYSGLSKNIEASTISELDLTEKDDKEFFDDILASVEALEASTPHVFSIRSKKEILLLLNDGRVEDERLAPPLVSKGIKKPTNRDSLKRMKLFGSEVGSPPVKRKTRKIQVTGETKGKLELVWISKELSERDLNIPSGSNTNATGSMLFKKGKIEDIDQRTFFRHEVFNNLQWQKDTRHGSTHLEKAEVSCELIVKGVNCGAFDFKLTHNPRTNTESYRQKNAMTGISWGEAKPVIAKKDLLGRELRLFRKIGKESFLIQID
jgi:hypothetical protein